MSVTNKAATEHEIGAQQIIVEWVTESLLIQKFLLNRHKIETESHENNNNNNNNKR